MVLLVTNIRSSLKIKQAFSWTMSKRVVIFCRLRGFGREDKDSSCCVIGVEALRFTVPAFQTERIFGTLSSITMAFGSIHRL